MGTPTAVFCCRSAKNRDSVRLTTGAYFFCALIMLSQTCAGGPARSPQAAGPPYQRVQAICIGINSYSGDSGFQDLAFAEADANDVCRDLESLFGYTPETLLGAKATRSSIIELLARAKNSLGPADVLIVYFAGHGHTVSRPDRDDGYIVPAGTGLRPDAGPPGSPAERFDSHAIPLKWLAQELKESGALHTIAIFDSCFSGFIAQQRGTPIPDWVSQPLQVRSCQVLTAGTKDQPSIEDPSSRHGLFTYHLLNELKRDPTTARTLGDVFEAVRSNLFRDTTSRTFQGKSVELHPLRRDLFDLGGDFVFLPTTLVGEAQDRELKDLAAKMRGAAVSAESKRTTSESVDDLRRRTQSGSKPSKSPVSAEDKERVAELTRQASNGVPEAMAALYYIYAAGIGTKTDPAKARYWARLANNTGTASGRIALSDAYHNGTGGERNATTAQQLLDAITGNTGAGPRPPTPSVEQALPMLSTIGAWLGRSAQPRDPMDLFRKIRDKLCASVKSHNHNEVFKQLARLDEWATRVAADNQELREACDQLASAISTYKERREKGLLCDDDYNNVCKALTDAVPQPQP